MATITVDFEELAGSPTEGWSETGEFRATRMLRCAWADRNKLARQLTGVSGSVITVPAAYPGVSGAYALSVDIQPAPNSFIGSTSGLNSYEYAHLTVQYGTVTNGSTQATSFEDDGVVLEESITPSVEILQVAGQRIFWDSGKTEPLEDIEAPGITVRMEDWQLRMRNVIEPPANMEDYVGYCNSEQIKSKTLQDRVFPAETLMFMGAPQSRTWTEDGPSAWDIDFRFQYRRTGWNRFFKSGTQEALPLYGVDGAEYKPFPTLDFVTAFELRTDS